MTDVLTKLDMLAKKHPVQSHELSGAQLAYIEWLLTPGHGSHRSYAQQHNIPETTLSGWRNEHRSFKEEWERQAKKVNGGLERTQVIMDALFERAQRDNKAAELYLRLVEKYTPTTREIHEDRAVEKMSDAELEAAVLQTRKEA